jgi:3-oxoacyl-[acyl-carrier-protein] synthase II
MKSKRVVITGIGPLSSIGTGKENLWNGLLHGKPFVTSEKFYLNGDLWDEFPVQKIDNFDLNHFSIDKSSLDYITHWKEGEESTDLSYLLAVVKLALDDAKLSYDYDSNNIGCIITHENAGLEQYFTKVITLSHSMLNGKDKNIVEYAQYLHDKSIKSAYDMQTFMVLFHIMKVFQLHGFSLFLNNACASGLYAFENAAQIIKSGRCPAVVVAGADYPRIYKYLWFKSLNMYEFDGRMKPFDLNAKGIVFGDGGAGFILEDYEHAQKRDAHIYAEYLGGGFTQEAWKAVFPSVGSEHYPNAIRDALKFSECKEDEIDLICAHGAGNTVIDLYEAKAITKVFNNHVPVTAFKPYVGHNLGGNNLLETAILLMNMENDMILPVLNTTEINPKAKINVIKEMQNKQLQRVMKICCAFAGFNGAAVFGKV